MASEKNHYLSTEECDVLLNKLKDRFIKNMQRHPTIVWEEVLAKLESSSNGKKLWSLNEMERTGGEPDVVGQDATTLEFLFFDCAAESPKGRRSFCYDKAALLERKDFPPANNVIDSAIEMGIELLSEEQYLTLQKVGKFDAKTSSWLKTPDEFRVLGGALFGDFRFGRVFVYHNGAQSYYAGRGFRGLLRV